MTEQPPALSPHAYDLASRRAAYQDDELSEDGLAPHPLGQFERWYRAAVEGGPSVHVPEPNAMVLGTVGLDGGPTSRTVLLKGLDGRGFVFFTNYTSRKATEIARDPRVSLCFPWYGLRRQVTVRGVAARVSAQESAAYFVTRPWGSRIGAWASRQSRPATDREQLDVAWSTHAQRWPDHGREDDVPVPDFWGGFVVAALEVEFWQGRSGRLHDRLAFVASTGGPTRLDDAGEWRVERRQP